MEREHDTIPSPPPEEESPESDRKPMERPYIPRQGDDGND